MTTLAFLLQDSSVSAIAVAISVVTFVYSRIWQKELERRRLKQELFEMRFSVYKAILLPRRDPQKPLDDLEFQQLREVIERGQYIFSNNLFKLFGSYLSANTDYMKAQPLAILGGNIEHFQTLLANCVATEINLRTALRRELMLIEDDVGWRERLLNWVDEAGIKTGDDARTRLRLDSTACERKQHSK